MEPLSDTSRQLWYSASGSNSIINELEDAASSPSISTQICPSGKICSWLSICTRDKAAGRENTSSASPRVHRSHQSAAFARRCDAQEVPLGQTFPWWYGSQGWQNLFQTEAGLSTTRHFDCTAYDSDIRDDFRASASPQWRRKLLFAALYFSEGAPIGFIWFVIPVQLRLAGLPLEKITASRAVFEYPLDF